MRVFHIFLISLMIFLGSTPIANAQKESNTMKTLHDFTVTTITGEQLDLSTLKGKKVMIVNTASECGFTPQYAALEELYQEMDNDKFVIIGFPSNDFGGQEPGTNEEIAAFCEKNYGVSFPMMAKVPVKGDEASPLYQWLTSKELNGVDDFKVKWNFHKFLIDENGQVVRDAGSQTAPADDAILDWIKG